MDPETKESLPNARVKKGNHECEPEQRQLTKIVEGDVELLYVDEDGTFGNSDHLFVT